MKQQLKIFCIPAFCAFIFPAPFPLNAQEADEDSDEVYELSPFTVTTEKDDRYYTSNAISGTQLNVPIKNIPFNLEVITSEFTRDIGAHDFKESLAFSSGIYTQTYVDTSGSGPANGNRSPSEQAAVGDRTNNAIVIRGMTAPFQQRMGFRVGSYIGIRGRSSGQGSSGSDGMTLGSLIDNVNMDRSEVVRGPGSLLYGLGALSGIVNVIPKRPLDQPRYELSVTVGNYDYYRATLDATGPLIRGEGGRNILNYRLLGAYQDNKEWFDFFREKKDYEAFQLEWKPNQNLKIFGEVARGRQLLKAHQGANASGYYIRAPGGDWQSPYPQSKEFVNAYGGDYQWGADNFLGPYPQVWDAAWWSTWLEQQTSGDNSKWLPGDSLPTDPMDQMSQPLDGYTYNQPGYQYAGRDPWYERVEESALLNLEWKVNDNLSLMTGGFYTKQESEELHVTSQVVNNQAFNSGYLNLRQLVIDGEIPEGHLFTVWNPTAETVQDIPIHRAIASYWRKTPQDGESLQFRAVATYNFQTPFLFGSDADHTFLAGRQDLRNHANVWVGNAEGNDIYWNAEDDSLEDSPVRIHSFYDWAMPLSYDGQKLVIPQGDANDYTTTLWETGHYLIYTGKFFNDRLTVLGGWRHDRYQAKETRWFHDWRDPVRYAPGEIVPRTGKSATGETYYNFVDSTGTGDAFTTGTWSYGFTFEITDSLSIYAVSAGGSLPNTGLRDGNYDAIPPEQTRNQEVGFKFGFLDDKIAGTISFFKTDRENAIWEFANAPNPGQWIGGRDPNEEGNANPGGAVAAGVPLSYGFNYHLFFKDKVEGPDGAYWQEKLGIEYKPRNQVYGLRSDRKNDLSPVTNDKFDPSKTPNPNGGILHISRATSLSMDQKNLTPDFTPYVFISYDALNPDSESYDPELHAIALEAVAAYRSGDHPQYIAPLGFGNSGVNDSLYVGQNASRRSGANVTFEEEVKGVDIQMVISPSRNLQFTLNYSHVNREASSDFNLLPAIDQLRGGDSLATEFDIWVMNFDEGAFADPRDPTTLKNGIIGKSLYYGSEDSFSIWGRYSFTEGPLDGFGVGLGAIYNGPAQTFIPIGTAGNTANRYPTPDTEENLQFRGALYYTKEFRDFTLRLQLNVSNLTNKKTLYSENARENPDTGEIERRNVIAYLMPRTWRLSCTIIF